MIARVYMDANLRRLARLYRDASTTKDSLFFAKLAVLELCGWIEESMDDVVLRCATRCLHEAPNRQLVLNAIVKRNFGFDYQSNFREMLMKLIGLAQVEKLERRLDSAQHARFTSTLSALKTVRNAEAHTHIKGVTKTINAPSLTISQFNDVYAGLAEYDRVLRRFIL